MQLEGVLINWNDEKGFGFVNDENGAKIFVHIKAFKNTKKRPVDGDKIVFQKARDQQGRFIAKNISFAKDANKRTPLFSSQLIIGVLLFSALILLCVVGMLPKYIVAFYSILSCVSFLRYWSDKNSAKLSLFRTSESSLLFVDLLGGWFGGLLAQRLFRHKVSKASYQSQYWLMVLINLIGLALLVYFGIAEDIRVFMYQLLKNIG